MHIITRMVLGGAQENTLLSCRGQKIAGHEICLVMGPAVASGAIQGANSSEHREDSEGSLETAANTLGISCEHIPSLRRELNPWHDIAASQALRRSIRRFRPDIVHTHSSKAGILGRWAAWKEKVPGIVHTIHGLPFHPYEKAWKNYIYIVAEKFAARRCHCIICVADAMANQAAAAGVADCQRFITVRSGMEIEPFIQANCERNKWRNSWNLNSDDLVIGKIARLYALKGHDDLLDILSELAAVYPRIKLVFIGDGAWRQRLEKRAQDLGVEKRVIFAGLIPAAQVPGAIGACDVVAHCSYREGLARVLPQALLAGKPVVSYDVDGAREVIIPGQTGWLVRPGDKAALLGALHEILGNLPYACLLAQKGRLRCQQEFDWQIMSARLLEIYQNCLAKK